MAMVVDASALFALVNRDDPEQERVRRLLEGERPPLVTSELALAEADYLVLNRLGIGAELEFLQDLAGGLISADCLTLEEIGLAHTAARRYRDLRLGLADCSLVVLAYRHQTRRIATLNLRHFRAITPLQGGAFTLLPADA